MRRAFLVAVALLLVVGTSLIAQSDKRPYTGGQQDPAPLIPLNRPAIIGIAHNYFAHPYSQSILRQFDIESRKYPSVIKDLIWTNAEGSSTRQIANVENLIAAKVDLIILDPWEGEALMPAVRKLIDAHIPVILIDRSIPSENFTAYVSGSNITCGKQGAEHIVRKLKEKYGEYKGNVVELQGTLGATAYQDRHTGFMSVMSQYPNIKVLASPETGEGKDEGIRVMEDLMVRFPQIDAVMGQNDDRALGAYQAAKEAGRQKGLIVVGIDGMKVTYESIMAGELSATECYPSGGTEAIQTAVKVLRGEAVPHLVTLPILEVNSDNVQQEYNVAKSYLEGRSLNSPKWGNVKLK